MYTVITYFIKHWVHGLISCALLASSDGMCVYVFTCTVCDTGTSLNNKHRDTDSIGPTLKSWPTVIKLNNILKDVAVQIHLKENKFINMIISICI